MRVDSKNAVIITALAVEFRAILEHLDNSREIEHPAGTLFTVGDLSTETSKWQIAVIQGGMGNSRSALETERAITFFNATYAFFVGVAGGLKDVAVGDVVAATKVYQYLFGKANDTFLPRPEFGESAYRLIQRAQSIASKEKWRNRIKKTQDCEVVKQPTAFIGPIAAGEQVVVSRESNAYNILRANYSDALAVEMEGYGFFRAIHANQSVQAILIRGISDLIEGKTEADATGSQVIASKHAAAFTFELISDLEQSADPYVLKPQSVDSNVWQDLYVLLPSLYPQGPQEQAIWTRAGGDLSTLQLSSNGRTNWFGALEKLNMGGGGSNISFNSLVKAVIEDYPQNKVMLRIQESMNSR